MSGTAHPIGPRPLEFAQSAGFVQRPMAAHTPHGFVTGRTGGVSVPGLRNLLRHPVGDEGLPTALEQFVDQPLDSFQILHLLTNAGGDTGPGFSPADLTHIFEPMYRGDTLRNASTGGAGLGITIARRIFRSHGGDLFAENSPSGDAVLTGWIPQRDLVGSRERMIWVCFEWLVGHNARPFSSSARKRQEEVKRVSLMREHKLLSVHGGDVPRALDKMLVILHVRDLKHS